MTNAFERHLAASVLATRQWDTAVAVFTVEAELAATLVWPFAVSVHWVAAFLADGNIAQIAGPSRKALDVTIVVAHVVRVFVLRVGDLTGLAGWYDGIERDKS